MVIYIESVFAFNVLVDYLLLFGAARVAGRTVAREKTFARRGGRRYLCGSAALFAEKRRFVAAWARFDGRGGVSRQWAGGQADAAVFPCLVRPRWRGDALRAESGVDGAPCARRGDSRPAVGRLPDRCGDVVFAAFRRVPLRRGADRERDGGCGHRLIEEKRPAWRLLRDTGNTLCDPVTGLGVPVIDRHALGDLISEEETATLPHIAYCSVGNADGTLPLLRCEAITVDEIKLGSRAVALAEHPLGDGGAYAGLWCEGCEKGEKHGELAQNAVA